MKNEYLDFLGKKLFNIVHWKSVREGEKSEKGLRIGDGNLERQNERINTDKVKTEIRKL